jgi:type IV pilus assembly protein PilE
VRRSAGFTLVELMIAVAVLGILAGILVLSFAKPTRKAKTRSEVNAMFAELHRAQQQNHTENGRYFSTGSDVSDIYPSASTLSSTSQAVDAPDTWTEFKVTNVPNNLYCGYVAISGTSSTSIPAIAVEFGMEQPDRTWYVLYAECNIDDDSDVNSKYFASSVDATLQVENEGK